MLHTLCRVCMCICSYIPLYRFISVFPLLAVLSSSFLCTIRILHPFFPFLLFSMSRTVIAVFFLSPDRSINWRCRYSHVAACEEKRNCQNNEICMRNTRIINHILFSFLLCVPCLHDLRHDHSAKALVIFLTQQI